MLDLTINIKTHKKNITENNNALNNYISINAEPVQMGDIWVKLYDSDPTIIVGYSSGQGKLQIASNITKINSMSFYTNNSVTSVDFSQATSLSIISDFAFSGCTNLTGDLVIPSNVTSIGIGAFELTSITSLDLSWATSLTTINAWAFQNCSNLTGELVISSNEINIQTETFFRGANFDNLYFLSETPPTSFGTNWQPTVTGKVYVPSEAAKETYLKAENFGFDSSQVQVIGISGKQQFNINEKTKGFQQYTITDQSFIPTKWEIVMTEEEKPEWLSIDNNGLLSWSDQCVAGRYKFKIKAINDLQSYVESAPIFFIVNESIKPKKLNISLILALLILLGIPTILAVGFGVWYLTKKKKTTVKI